MDKTEWPTEQRLQDLRKEGLVAYSRVATLCFVTIVMLIAMKAMEGSFVDFVDSYREFSVRYLSGEMNLSGIVTPLKSAATILILLACVSAAAVVIAGLAQTKVLLTGEFVSFNLARLSPAGRFNLLSLPLRLFSYLVLFVVSVLLAAGGGYMILRSALTLLNRDSVYAVQWVSKLYADLLPILLLALGVIMTAAYFWARQYFRFSHRMSRQEVEQEG